MNNTKKGFTLVELIVVITILAILGTIAFLAFQGYSASARDSKRIADMNTIKTSLELFGLNSGKFPDPVNPVMITYSSGTINDLNLRQQGIFGQQNVTNVSSAGKLDRLPKDPLTELEYTYSVTLNKKEFELGTILENDEVAFYPINLANAASKKVVSAFIKGNYNGKILKTSSGTTSYIFAVPSIINSDATLTDINQLISPINKLAYNGFANLPASYDGPTFEVNGAPDKKFVNVNEILVFEGDTGNLILPDNSTPRIELLEAIKDAYSGTDLAGEGDIKNIVNLEISDPANPTPLEEYLAGLIANNDLGGDLKLVPVPIPSNGTGTVDDGTEENPFASNSFCGGNHYNPGGGNWWTDDLDCSSSSICEYTYDDGPISGDEDFCGANDGCDCWWGQISYIYTCNDITQNVADTLNTTFSLNYSKEKWCNLETLDLSDEGLNSLPNEITYLTHLKTLNLSDNSLGNLSIYFDSTISNSETETNITPDNSNITITSGGGNINISSTNTTFINTCNDLTQSIADTLNSTFLVNYSKEKWCNLETLEYHGSNGCDTYNNSNNNILSNILKNIIPVVNAGECDAIPYLTTLPSEIGYLTHLTTLDLSYNYLTYLPSEILNLTNLTTLNLAYNGLGNLSNYFDANTSNTQTEVAITPDDKDITITTGGGNINITATNTVFTYTCSNLTQTIADTLNNTFGYNYSKEKWCNLENLDLSNRGLNSVPSEISYLAHLKTLNLIYNNDLGNLSNSFDANISDTQTEIDITPDDKDITITTGGGNINITATNTIFTYTCSSLTQTVADTLNNSFGYNYSKEKWCNLTTLDLKFKLLTSLPSEIGYLIHLTNLNLLGNRLVSIPTEIGNLTQLTYLNLDNNTSLINIPTEIGNLTELTYLNLNSVPFSTFPNWVTNFTDLEFLDIGNYKYYDNIYFKSLPENFGDLNKLKILKIHWGNLTSLPDSICNLTQLTYLDLAFNDLTRLPTNFGNLSNLEEISLYENNLSKLPNSLSQLNKLTDLELGENDSLGTWSSGLSRNFRNNYAENRYKANITLDGKSIRIISDGSGVGTLNISVY